MSLRDTVPKPLWEKLRFFKAWCKRMSFRLLWIFPVDPDKIVFDNYFGKGYGDNSKAIAEEFIHRGKGKLYWLYEGNVPELPASVCPIRENSLRANYHLATAAIWVDNCRKEPYIDKRKNQFYLQAWHGSIPLKQIEKDAENVLERFYVEGAKRDSRMADLMLSNSAFADKMFRNSFWYTGEIKRFGSPRLDSQFHKGLRERARKELGIDGEELVLLYAPTFRLLHNGDAYDVDFAHVTGLLRQKTGKNVTVLIRLHPNLSRDHLSISCERSIDVSAHPDVYELMAASDILITDYSSLMFEFPIAKSKPVFCYVKDLEEYDRGCYFKIETLPFSFSRTNEELTEKIRDFDQKEYDAKLSAFYAELELCEDGKAAQRTVDYLLEKTNVGQS